MATWNPCSKAHFALEPSSSPAVACIPYIDLLSEYGSIISAPLDPRAPSAYIFIVPTLRRPLVYGLSILVKISSPGVSHKSILNFISPSLCILSRISTSLRSAPALDIEVRPYLKHSSRSEEHTSELQSPDHLVCR